MTFTTTQTPGKIFSQDLQPNLTQSDVIFRQSWSQYLEISAFLIIFDMPRIFELAIIPGRES